MKLALGTVQFGLSYGAFNEAGQVAPAEAGAILELARAAGIDTLDTAHAYGSSEQVLGGLQAAARFRVVTKVPALGGADAMAARLSDCFGQSLARLGTTQVHGLLLHRAADLLEAGGDAVWREMEALKARGQVRRIGFSAYGADEALRILERFPVELVQLPLNVFDTRHRDAGVLALCHERGIEVHVRSVFLQGFALAAPGALRGHLAKYRGVLERFRAQCEAAGLTPLQGALRHALAQPAVDKVLTGVENQRQLAEIVQAAAGTLADVGAWEHVRCPDADLVDPSRWR